MKKKNRMQLCTELVELVTRIFCDTAPHGTADAAYLFAETEDNEISSFAAAVSIWRLKKAKKIAICDLGSAAGYRGAKLWTRKLVSLGIPAAAIITVKPAPEFPPSTHAEALGLIRLAKNRKWKTIYIIAPPLHQLRAFVSTASFAQKENRKLKIYNFHGIAQRWEDRVVHSQGIQSGTRSELIGKELEKFEHYCRDGSLLAVKMVLVYLNRRDGQ